MPLAVFAELEAGRVLGLDLPDVTFVGLDHHTASG